MTSMCVNKTVNKAKLTSFLGDALPCSFRGAQNIGKVLAGKFKLHLVFSALCFCVMGPNKGVSAQTGLVKCTDPPVLYYLLQIHNNAREISIDLGKFT